MTGLEDVIQISSVSAPLDGGVSRENKGKGYGFW